MKLKWLPPEDVIAPMFRDQTDEQIMAWCRANVHTFPEDDQVRFKDHPDHWFQVMKKTALKIHSIEDFYEKHPDAHVEYEAHMKAGRAGWELLYQVIQKLDQVIQNRKRH